jgi:hypothetical protein
MLAFRKSLGIRFGISAPAWLIKLGTAAIGVDSELILRGMNVKSAVADDLNFRFDYETVESALRNLHSAG